MITADEMRRRYYERPFRPFRIYLADGRQFDIPEPTWYAVGEPILIVGIAADGEAKPGIPDRTEWIAYDLIDRVELIPARSSAA